MSRVSRPPVYTAQFCEAGYNWRLGAPDAQARLSALIARAQAARGAARRLRQDVPYGPSSAERLDFFLAETPNAPLLVFFHGGYWRSLDKSDFSWIAEPFNACGASVAIVNYGLAPRVAIEDIVRQCLRASAWLWRRAPDYGVDRSRMVVSGHSAGGHLAAMMLAARWHAWERGLPERIFHAGVAVSGLFDLEPVRHAPFLKADLKLSAERVAALSPLYMTPASDAALVLAVGGEETAEFKRQSQDLAAAWSDVIVGHLIVSGADHLGSCMAMATPEEPLFQAIAAQLGVARATS